MKNNFLKDFVSRAQGNSKTAFIYKECFGYRKATFAEFLADVYKMCGYLKSQLKGDNVMIFSYPYSYYFYVGIFAAVFLGKNIVIVDSFSDKKKTRSMMEQAEVTDVLTDGLTRWLTFLLPVKKPVVNLTKFRSYGAEDCAAAETPRENASIITFTSGTTGMPKLIRRNLDFLESQIQLIRDNADIREDDVTYGLLPMYTLLSVLMNNTCLVSRDIKACSQFGATMLLAPIKKVLQVKTPLQTIQRAFLGGAILYKKETETILSKLPAADITYVYGASEGAVIYKTNLRSYNENPFTFDTKSKGIDVTILNPDANGVGEIQISGETVIGAAAGVTEDRGVHNTGDFGKIVDGKLVLLGRKKYSCSDVSFYNYQYDELLRKRNPKMTAGFSFYYEGKIHVAYCGALDDAPLNNLPTLEVAFHRYAKLPYDLKHKTKLDYGKVITTSLHPRRLQG
ncbi:MAG: acyl--CoA ligase [Fibrobacter sp.]|nr:acyl--CoA ligase [Fibrobacter sp.]